MRRLVGLPFLASALGGCLAVYGFGDYDTSLPATPDSGAAAGSVSFALAALLPARLRRGAQTTVAFTLDRHDEHGTITIAVDGLPPGISAAPIVVPSDASAATLTLSASTTAAFGAAEGIVHARSTAGGTLDVALGVTVVGTELDPTFGNGGIILGSPGESLEGFAIDAQGRSVLAVTRTVGDLGYIDIYRDDGNGGFGAIVALSTSETGEPLFSLAAPGARIVTTQASTSSAVRVIAYVDDDERAWTANLGNTRTLDARPIAAFPSADDMVIVTKEAVGSPPRETLVMQHVGVTDGGSSVVVDGVPLAGETPVAALATADGIVVCSSFDIGHGATLVRVRRVRDGKLDVTFGESGVRELEETDAGAVRCADLASFGGRVFVLSTSLKASRTATRAAVIALDRNGAVDPTFADGGVTTLAGLGSLGIEATKLALGADGRMRISAAAYETNLLSTAVVIGVTPNGDVDPTFGSVSGGYVTVPVSGTSSAESVWQLADGRVLVVGTLDIGVEDRWFVARYKG